MIYIGKHITGPGDPLHPTTIDKLFKAIRNENGEVAEMISRLQHIRAIDPGRYRKLKTSLPYIVCAAFHPMVRRKDNFLYTERMIVDIDHISENNIDIASFKQKLRVDPLVEMYFESPSGDGIKVLFKFSEKINDSSYYAMFYKKFCVEWGSRYQLGAALDTVTNDVSRACFVSYDPNVYYNPNAEAIQVSKILPLESYSALDSVQQEIKQHEKEQKQIIKEAGQKTVSDKPVLTDGILQQIKEKVGVRIRKTSPKEYIQPEELTALIPEIEKLLQEINVQLIKTKPISYGRMIRVGVDKHWAELNVFYGQKRGATVVRTTKTGSNKELLESVFLLIQDYFAHR